MKRLGFIIRAWLGFLWRRFTFPFQYVCAWFVAYEQMYSPALKVETEAMEQSNAPYFSYSTGVQASDDILVETHQQEWIEFVDECFTCTEKELQGQFMTMVGKHAMTDLFELEYGGKWS